MAVHINGGTMDYRNAQAAPNNHLAGIAVVVGVHLLTAWLVVSGVGSTIITAVLPPPIVITQVVQEPEKLPEPDVIENLAPPILTLPVLPISPIDVIPPDVPVIRGSDKSDKGLPNTGDVGKVTDTPVGNGDAGVGPNVGAGTIAVGVACPNSQSIRENMRYPLQAQRAGLQGEVEVEFTVSAAGVISGESIVSSTNRAFNSAALLATRQFKCVGQGQDVKVKVPYSFKLAD
jgi:periplasmic protein TonB